MADIGADVARACMTKHRVEIRAVKIDLPASVVHQVANATNRVLKYSVRRWVRNHDGADSTTICFNLGFEISQRDVARVTRNRHHSEPGYDSTRRVCPMGRHRDEAYVAISVTA